FLLPAPCSTLFPYTTLFRSVQFANCSNNANAESRISCVAGTYYDVPQTTSLAHASSVYSCTPGAASCSFFSNDFHLAEGCASYLDRKSTRLNSSHLVISYAV